MHLFEVAARNVAAYADAYRQLLDSLEHRELLTAFTSVVCNEGTVSINLRPWALANFLVSGDYLNASRFATELAHYLGVSTDQMRSAHLQGFAERRARFENLFADGNAFVYAALNIGGTGLSKYGQFCIILAQDFTRNVARPAYLPGDSLEVFFQDENPAVEDIVASLASEDSKHHLAALKHREDVRTVDTARWPEMVCSERTYIEAVFNGPVRVNNIHEVRIRKLDHDKEVDLAIRAFSDRLDDGAKALCIDLVQIKRRLQELHIPLEVVDRES